MLNQIDSEGFSTSMRAGIVDHCKDGNMAISQKNGYVVTKRGNKKKIKPPRVGNFAYIGKIIQNPGLI